MAEITVTAATVVPSTGAIFREGVADSAITIGEVVYVLTNGNIGLANAASGGASPIYKPVGIACTTAAGASQKIIYTIEDAALVFGAATFTSGTAVYLSDTAGKMTQTLADLDTGDYLISLGVAVSATTLALRICPTSTSATFPTKP